LAKGKSKSTGLLIGCAALSLRLFGQSSVNLLGDALAGGGVYTADNDPELIREGRRSDSRLLKVCSNFA
jgi:hypothetical protein